MALDISRDIRLDVCLFHTREAQLCFPDASRPWSWSRVWSVGRIQWWSSRFLAVDSCFCDWARFNFQVLKFLHFCLAWKNKFLDVFDPSAIDISLDT